MAMAAALRRFTCLALVLLVLLHITTVEHPRRATNDAVPVPPRAFLRAAMDTGIPSTGMGHAPSPPLTPYSEGSPLRRLDNVSASASASASVTASEVDAAALPPHDVAVPTTRPPTNVQAPRCVCTCTCTRRAPAAALVGLTRALPLLLAVPFLPPPLAALAALSSLASPARARVSDDCFQLTHATCAVYPYDAATRTVDRSYPVADMRSVCLHPLCEARSCLRNISVACGELNGRWGDPLHAYCTVATLEAKGDAWTYLPVQLPLADPHGVAASGGEVCYVELTHFSYREGYYVRCPLYDCSHVPRLSCTEFPPVAVAEAVWEHRRTTYRGTVGEKFVRYNYDIVGPLAV